MSSLINGYIGKLNPGDGTEYSLGSTAYAECATAAATTQKEIEMTGFTLMQGATIFVKFINGNTNDSPTLRIKTDTNSYTDIKNIIISNNLINNSLVNLTYDGTQWLADSSNLNSKILENNEPYSFRQTGGSTNVREIDANLEKIDSIIGGSIVWNQRFLAPFTNTINGITFTRTDSFSIKLSGTSTQVVYKQCTDTLTYTGHVYLTDSGTDNPNVKFYNDNKGVGSIARRAAVGKATADKTMYIRVASGAELDETIKPQLFDLTLMFGPTIADYIYSLETANAGAGVSWFRRYFPNDYYAYNAGTMESVQVSAHKTTGFNQFDKNGMINNGYISNQGVSKASENYYYTDYIRIIPGMAYCFQNVSGSNPSLCWYSEDKTFISGTAYDSQTKIVQNAPNNAYYVRASFPRTNLNTFCINFSYDGSHDGEYEPYIEHVYPLDSSLTLRGVPKLDANNRLYYDGDTYTPDGTVTRRYGIVDLGMLTWNYTTSGYFRCVPSNIRVPLTTAIVPDWILLNSIKYKTESSTHIVNSPTTYDKCVTVTVTGYLAISDSAYTDAADFKAAMSGIMLVYELAAPTTETADPYTQIQKCSAYGIEEFIDAGDRDFSMPVGHITQYQNGSWIEDPLKIENKNTTLNWNTTSTIATIGGQDITVKLPTNPNDDIAAGTTGQFWRGDKTWSDTLVGDLTLAPTSAGNISSGRLYIEGANGKKAGFIMSQDRNNLDVGWDWGSKDGSGMAFRGTNANDHTGSFIFFARNSAATTQLIGEPNGELYWYKYTGSSTPKFIIGAQSSSYNFDVRGTSYLGGNTTVVGNLSPEATNTRSLGSSNYHWAKLYIGTAESYGATNLPIYWNAGVPTTVNAQDTANNLIDNLADGTSVPLDGDTYIASYADGNNVDHNGTNTYHRRPISQLYTYMKNKLAITNNNINLNWNTETTIATIGGTAIKVKIPDNPSPIYYSDLDFTSVTPNPGAYRFYQTNPITNVTEFGGALSLPGRSTSQYHYAAQMIISSASGKESPTHAYIRRLTDGQGFSDWSTIFDNRSNLIPKDNTTFNIGSSSYKYANIYATTFQGALNGNAASATKVNNSFTLQIASGTTEGTNKYTFDGSAVKTVNIQAGSGISLTPAANSLTITGTTITFKDWTVS